MDLVDICFFEFYFGLVMGVWKGDVFKILAAIGFSLDDNLGIGAFFMVVILKEWEIGISSVVEEPFLWMVKRCRGRRANSFREMLLLNASFSFYNFSASSNDGSYFNFSCLR